MNSYSFVFVGNVKLTNGPNKLSVTIHYAKKGLQQQTLSLLETFVSYDENEVLWIWPLGPELSKIMDP